MSAIKNERNAVFGVFLQRLDSSMVFITGMPAGGGMSNAMLNAYPELFNAGTLLL